MVKQSEADRLPRWDYHDLMLHRVHEILLVASPYDAYILEEDGRLTEQILSEYLGMNLSYAPRVWRASSASEALEMLLRRHYDLIITLLRITDMDPNAFGRRVKQNYPNIPVILLVYDVTEISHIRDHLQPEAIDRTFVWSGNANVFPVIIKYIEDRQNVKRDIQRGDVRAIIIVEDNPLYYSIILPLVYAEILYHTRALMDRSLNDTHRLLRLRARPKILLATEYEEAQNYVEMCGENLLGIISDVRFPRKGQKDPNAGYRLIQWVREKEPLMPILFQSSNLNLKATADELRTAFLYKHSKTLIHDLRTFIKENFGFGDFVFRAPDGKEVARATTFHEMEKLLLTVTDESIVYHATRNHFSNWLAARGEFSIASQVRIVQISDFPDAQTLREYLVSCIEMTRHVHYSGRVYQYKEGPIDPSSNFIRVRGGSLGGKARGLAFATNLIEQKDLQKSFPNVTIRIPRIAVVATDEFDDFMNKNDLWQFVFDVSDFDAIKRKFLSAQLSKEVIRFLKTYLGQLEAPLAIRSSGLLEDMHFQSLAGLYATYMISNRSGSLTARVKKVSAAIKLVYASMFSNEVKVAMEASSHLIEDEKMAIIIQELVGETRNNRFYPTFSGVGQSLNYYPVSYMKREEGAVHVALGLGKTIAEGGKALRFSPKYPSILPQFYSTEAILENSQTAFYALDLTKEVHPHDINEEDNLDLLPLSVAEEDGTLRHVGSVITAQDDIVRDSLSYEGPRVVTFANILKTDTFPLSDISAHLLDAGHAALGCPVEAEFACNISDDPEIKSEFCLLQVRPMTIDTLDRNIQLKTIDEDSIVCRSSLALGNGRIEDLSDVVFVKPAVFDTAKTGEMASEIAEFNREMRGRTRYLLMGPGRWGSADPWLGIPVKWDHISRVKVIVEVGLEEVPIDPSFGSHFFQNVTSFHLGYLTVSHKGGHDFIDWDWLGDQPVYRQSPLVTWVRLENPLSIWIDGQTGMAVIRESVSIRKENGLA